MTLCVPELDWGYRKRGETLHCEWRETPDVPRNSLGGGDSYFFAEWVYFGVISVVEFQFNVWLTYL